MEFKMLNPKIFIKILAIFSEIYGFEYSENYSNVVYESLKNQVNDSDFKYISNAILKETKLEDWNKAYGYGKKPAPADWLEAFEMKPQWIKKDEYYIEPNTGANCVKQIMVKVGNQLTIKE